MNKRNISSKEWKITLFIILGVLIISQLPLIFGYLTEGPNEKFMGIPVHVTDVNNHLNWVLQAKEGHILFSNAFTYENIPSLIFNPFHLITGLTAKITNIPIIWVYNIFSWLLIIGFGFTIYFIISYFIKDKETRLTAFLLTLLSSGFGLWWKISKLIFGKWVVSSDLWVTEMNTFQSFGQPHFVLSTILILWVFYFTIKSLNKSNIKFSVYAGLLLLLLTTVHLFDTITVAFIITGWFVYLQIIKQKWSWNDFSKLTIIGTITLPAIGYYFWVFFMNTAYKEWNSLNLTTTPNLIEIISGFGLIFFFSLIYIWNERKNIFKKENKQYFLVIWIVLNFILIYLPINVQRRFIMGLHIPLAILSAIAIQKYVIPYIRKHIKINKVTIYVLIILISSATTIYLLASQISNLHIVPDSDYGNRKYLTNEEYNAIKWLDENTNNEEIIIAPYYLSNYIPAMSGNKVYCGHWAQTINFKEKCKQVELFYNKTYKFNENYYYFDKKTMEFIR